MRAPCQMTIANKPDNRHEKSHGDGLLEVVKVVTYTIYQVLAFHTTNTNSILIISCKRSFYMCVGVCGDNTPSMNGVL